MGYTTEFRGTINLEPVLTAAQVAELETFAEERHGGNVDVYAGFPGFWCQWIPTNDGAGIEWDGNEKFYHGEEWMKLIIDRFLKPWGIVGNGLILAQGEEIDDRWELIVKDNVVSTKKLR